MQGWRSQNEDTHIAELLDLPGQQKGMLFGVFDGHGGDKVALDAKKKFTSILIKKTEFCEKGDYTKALEQAFRDFDKTLSNQEYANRAGCTACVVLITSNRIYCANSGDSRAVLCSGNSAKPMSCDHKPNSKLERKRIENADHVVMGGRVNGELSVSRGFGDFKFKKVSTLNFKQQAVIAHPDVTCSNRSKDDKFIMLACDGIWETISNEECVK